MTGREGRLTVEGDRAVLTFERRLPFPIDAVWSAITDPDERDEVVRRDDDRRSRRRGHRHGGNGSTTAART